MKTYKQTVKFERCFVIEARNAEEANAKLDEAVRRVEFDADVEEQGHYEFEDEPVECPECEGSGVIGDEEKNCARCDGSGSIPFADAQVSP